MLPTVLTSVVSNFWVTLGRILKDGHEQRNINEKITDSNNEVENYSVRDLEEKRGKYLREGRKK